jgi:hypothetical protein
MHIDNHVFCFGSNLAGRHGAGAAKTAAEYYGAKYGVGVGRTGNAYAIPTKDHNLNVLPLDVIRQHVNDFEQYALAHPELTFMVTRIGCGLAGYQNEQIGIMFRDFPINCFFDIEWLDYI